jgi:hypothetical protein
MRWLQVSANVTVFGALGKVSELNAANCAKSSGVSKSSTTFVPSWLMRDQIAKFAATS